jgi:hypothetical protein
MVQGFVEEKAFVVMCSSPDVEANTSQFSLKFANFWTMKKVIKSKTRGLQLSYLLKNYEAGVHYNISILKLPKYQR